MTPEPTEHLDDFADLSALRSPVKRGEMFLQELNDPRRDAVLAFHEKHRDQIEASRDSKIKHQAWEGAYMDHLAECFRMIDVMY